MSETNIKQDTIRGLKWSMIEKFSVQIVSFILGLIMARILQPSDFGIIGMLSIFFAISESLVDCGFSNALIRKINCSETDYSTVFYFNIVISILCYIILYFSSPYIAGFFNMPILEPLVQLLALNIILNSFITVQRAKLTIKIDFKSQAMASFVSSLLGAVIGIFLAKQGYGVWSIAWQMVSTTFFTVVIITYITKWRPKLIFSWESFKPLFSFGSKLALSGLIETFYSNFTTFLIGKVYSPTDLGFYTRGHSIANLPSRNITNIIQKVSFPILAQIQNNNNRLIEIYRKYISISSLVIFFLMMILAGIAKPLVIILLTDKWVESALYLQIFCFVMMFDHINLLNLNLLKVKGRSDLYLRLQIIKKMISLGMVLLAIPFGPIAVCSVLVVYVQIAIVINTYYTGKLFNMGYKIQIMDYSKYFVLALISCLPSFILSFYIVNNYINIIVGIVLPSMIYYTLLRKDKYMIEIISIVNSYLKIKKV